MTIDYALVAADLEQKRSAIDQVLDGLRQLASGEPRGSGGSPKLLPTRGGVIPRRRIARRKPKTKPAPAARAKPLAPHHGRRPRFIAPEKLARAKAAWDHGESPHQVAQLAGVGDSSVYPLAQRQGWGKRGSKAHEHLTDPGFVRD